MAFVRASVETGKQANDEDCPEANDEVDANGANVAQAKFFRPGEDFPHSNP
jgi:hypothetical protein